VYTTDDSRLPCFIETRKKGKFSFSPVKHFIKNNRIVSYSDLSFKGLISEGIIGEVIIGPKSQLTEADTEYFLSANGFYNLPVGIKRSMASYR